MPSPLVSHRMCPEKRWASSGSMMSRALRSWVPEMGSSQGLVGTAGGVGENTRQDFLGAPEALRLTASSRGPPRKLVL